jgi:hypothetical protein
LLAKSLSSHFTPLFLIAIFALIMYLIFMMVNIIRTKHCPLAMLAL